MRAPEEYGVYENGECIALPEEMGGFFQFSEEAQSAYKERELSTKRGIKIGSTARELAKAYKEYEFEIPAVEKTITTDEFMDNMSEYHNGLVTITTFADNEGNLWDSTEWNKWITTKEGAETVYLKGKQIAWYSIGFLINDNNIVEDIMVYYSSNYSNMTFG